MKAKRKIDLSRWTVDEWVAQFAEKLKLDPIVRQIAKQAIESFLDADGLTFVFEPDGLHILAEEIEKPVMFPWSALSIDDDKMLETCTAIQAWIAEQVARSER